MNNIANIAKIIDNANQHNLQETTFSNLSSSLQEMTDFKTETIIPPAHSFTINTSNRGTLDQQEEETKNLQHLHTIPIKSPKTTKIGQKLSNLNLLGLEKY